MKLLFYLSRNYSIPVVAPIIRAIDTSRNDVTYHFYVSEAVAAIWPIDWDRNKVLNGLKEVRAFHPDFVLCPGNHVDFRMPGLKVQLFHGVGVEKKSHFEIRHFFDVYCTSGPFVTERFKALQIKYKYFHVIETGWPKFDHLLNPANLFSGPPEGLDEGKRVILYAPTFSRRLESASTLSDTLLAILKEDEHLLIKFHELMPQDLKDKFLHHNNHRIKIIEEGDITPWLHMANLMISDTSSVVYEFMALRKPVITYRSKSLEEKALNIQNPHELRSAIDLLWEQPDFEASKRWQYLSMVNPYLDGKASERILNALDEILDQKIKPKRKPLNLFRKAQVLYKYYFQRRAFD